MCPRAFVAWLVAAAFVALAARADAATAASRTSSLAWVRAERAGTCIAGKELADAVERILGRRVFVSASAADVSIEGGVDRSGAHGWKATLRISDEHGALLGSRELESEPADCRAMDASLAFVIAVMIDPDAAAHPPAPIDAAPAAAPPPRATSRWTIAPQAGMSVALGELPSLAWGPTFALRLGPESIGVELLGAYFVPERQAIAGASGVTASFTWAYAGVALCPTLARGASLALVGCAGALAGLLGGTPSSGLDGEQSSSNVEILATLRARLEWRLAPPLFAIVQAGGDVPFARPAWTVTSAAGVPSTVFEPSAVAAEAGLAIGVALE